MNLLFSLGPSGSPQDVPMDADQLEYSPLYKAIGTSWGDPDGPSENRRFNLPDLRGMFLRGVTSDSGRDPDFMKREAIASGGNTGAAVGSYQSHAFAVHSHMQRVLAPPGATSRDRVRVDWTVDAPGRPFDQNSAYTHDAGQSIETRPRNVFVNYIIKL
ncbi:MAG: tail fiber protein [Chitinophagaceae bacterium]|nr:MAG: tail fiber protein [Chitinophagaceae bacterium]